MLFYNHYKCFFFLIYGIFSMKLNLQLMKLNFYFYFYIVIEFYQLFVQYSKLFFTLLSYKY